MAKTFTAHELGDLWRSTSGRDWWKRKGTEPKEEFEGSVLKDDIGK